MRRRIQISLVKVQGNQISMHPAIGWGGDGSAGNSEFVEEESDSEIKLD